MKTNTLNRKNSDFDPSVQRRKFYKTSYSILQKFGDVLVINDGSIDKTGECAHNAGAELITNVVNQGYEYSLNEGYKYACDQDYDIMITIDADGQLPT